MHREGRCLERVEVYYSPRFLCPLTPSRFSPLSPPLLPFLYYFPIPRFGPVKLSGKFNLMQSFSFSSKCNQMLMRETFFVLLIAIPAVSSENYLIFDFIVIHCINVIRFGISVWRYLKKFFLI